MLREPASGPGVSSRNLENTLLANSVCTPTENLQTILWVDLQSPLKEAMVWPVVGLVLVAHQGTLRPPDPSVVQEL